MTTARDSIRTLAPFCRAMTPLLVSSSTTSSVTCVSRINWPPRFTRLCSSCRMTTSPPRPSQSRPALSRRGGASTFWPGWSFCSARVMKRAPSPASQSMVRLPLSAIAVVKLYVVAVAPVMFVKVTPLSVETCHCTVPLSAAAAKLAVAPAHTV